MDKKTLSKQVIIEKGGIAKTSDFVAAGIPAVDVVNLCNTGYLERIRHGYYQLAGGDTSSEEQLLATLIPKAIICVESALFYYDKLLPLSLSDAQAWHNRHSPKRPRPSGPRAVHLG